jgi:hypothetical protein
VLAHEDDHTVAQAVAAVKRFKAELSLLMVAITTQPGDPPS